MAAVGAVGCLVSAATTAHAQNRFYRCQSTNSGQQWQREWEWFNLDGTASFHTFYFAPTGSFPFVPGDSDLTKQTGYYNYGDVTALGDYTQSDTAVYYHNTRFGVTCYGTPAGNGYYDIHQDYDPVSGTLEVKEYAFDDDCPASDDAGADRQGPFDPESAGLRLDDCTGASSGWDATDDSGSGGGGGDGGGGGLGSTQYCAWLVYFDEWGNIISADLIGCWYQQD
jgi:hypothetical protein